LLCKGGKVGVEVATAYVELSKGGGICDAGSPPPCPKNVFPTAGGVATDEYSEDMGGGGGGGGGGKD